MAVHASNGASTPVLVILMMIVDREIWREGVWRGLELFGVSKARYNFCTVCMYLYVPNKNTESPGKVGTREPVRRGTRPTHMRVCLDRHFRRSCFRGQK